MRAYGQSFVSSRSNTLAITSNLNASDPLRPVATPDLSSDNNPSMGYPWLCSAYPNLTGQHSWGCDIDGLSRYSSDWDLVAVGDSWTSLVLRLPIQYCLSQPVEEHCRLQLSLIIMCVVISAIP